MPGLPPGGVECVTCVYDSLLFELAILTSHPTVRDAPESGGLRLAVPLLHSAQKLCAAFPIGLVRQPVWQQASLPYAASSKCPVCQAEHIREKLAFYN